MKSGIYIIKNLVNNKVYVGQSINLRRRRNNHFRQLRKNTHCNQHLQRSFIKYGENNFQWQVLEYVNDLQRLDACEKKWIKSYKRELTYNSGEGGNNNFNSITRRSKRVVCYSTVTLNKIATHETISIAARFHNVKESTIHRICNYDDNVYTSKRKIFFCFEGDTRNYHRITTYLKSKYTYSQLDIETGETLATYDTAVEVSKKFKCCRTRLDNKAKIGSVYKGYFWCKTGEEHKWNPDVKYSVTKSIIQLTLNGKFIKKHVSTKIASQDTKIPRTSISGCLRGRVKHAGGFKWKYADE